MVKPNGRRIQSIVLLAGVGVGVAASAVSSRAHHADRSVPARSGAPASQAADNCVACHEKRPDDPVNLFKSSTHGRTRKTCSSCHGGDGSASERASAHSGRFIGQPSSNDVLSMCGACHQAALAAFKTSRHFPDHRGSPRVDCVRCHGAHTVGSPSRNFSFANYCTGCHGLEYLPGLPGEIQKTLSMSDDLSDSIRALESNGHPLSADETQQRKEIRRSIAEIVHPTDLKGGLLKAAEVQERIRDLSRIIEKK